jgi:hypothetical protein
MSRSSIVLFACLFLLTERVRGAEPVLRVVRSARNGTRLMRNGGFEEGSGGKLRAWVAAPNGFTLAPGQGRNDSQALRCDAESGGGWFGASQTIALNRTNVAPLIVRGWSRAQDMSGSPDGGYSLYVDIVYADGTPLWGQTADFQTGTHGWQRRELVIMPQKPVKSLTLNCLVRRHSGRAWFDDVSVEEVRTQNGAVMFQGVPVTGVGPQPKGSEKPKVLATQDGLRLGLRDGSVDLLKLDGRDLAGTAPSGFLARDAAADSDFYGFSDGKCPELSLKLKTVWRATADSVSAEGRLSDTTGKDRAVTLVFALLIDAIGWRWGDDIRHDRLLEGRGEFSNVVRVRCGATGTMSLYPLAAIYNARLGLAVAVDMSRPAVYRLSYHAGTRQLLLAYDFGLVPETRRFPSSADFRFVLFRFDSKWGFRAAFQKLMRLFPEYFRVRSHDQGIWMPFTDVSTVQGWADFGFRYHEGNNNVAWDDAHGILSFRYTEPMTWWMRMPAAKPRTMAEATRERDRLAASGRGAEGRMARVAQVAGMLNEWRQPCLLFRNEPWCNGAVWSLNPNPDLPVSAGGQDQGQSAPLKFNAATVHWNPAVKASLYGPQAKGHLDGEYLDSLEGYVTAPLNFRRDHFRDTGVPLTFSSDSKRPALFKGLAVFEFTRWMSGQVHHLGKLLFANGVPYRFSWLCPWLDVLGTETDWLRDGKYHPASDRQMDLWRTMSGGKPYLLLMNTDYDVFTPEMVKRYFERSLFYGMFPSMFSHNAAEHPYWQNPKWYDRDRPLFKQYLPLVKRVAEAGWRPVTSASCDNRSILVERFGPDAKGTVYLTLLNDTTSDQTGTVRAETGRLGLGKPAPARELVSGTRLAPGTAWKVTLAPQAAEVIELAPVTRTGNH